MNYSSYNSQELILRDQLAIERTALANERTLLSYVRTMVGIIAVGATILKLFDGWFFILSGWCLIVLGMGVLSVGFLRYIKVDLTLYKLQRDDGSESTEWLHLFFAFVLRKLNLAKVPSD